MSIICVIPARLSSKRLPHKNWLGMPHTPAAVERYGLAVDSGLFSEVIVTVDIPSPEGDHWSYQGTPIVTLPESLRSYETTTADIISWVIDNYKCDYVCCLYAMAYAITKEDIETAFNILVSNRLHSIIGGNANDSPECKSCGSFQIVDAKKFSRNKSFLGPKNETVWINTSKQIDINTRQDYEDALEEIRDKRE